MSDIVRPIPHDFFADPEKPGPDALGMVVGGALTTGLEIKLDRDTMIEGLTVGSYVTITGDTGRKFFGLVTDIGLAAVDENIRKTPPSQMNRAMRDIYAGTAVYGTLKVTPSLLMERDSGEIKPVKTVPAHFSRVSRSTPEEILALFKGKDEDGEGKPYTIGAALDDPAVKITINLERLVERSTAVFGRSGTGKTFLTLPLLASVIQQQAASCLIFDMHNDYGGWLKGDKNTKLPGLKGLSAIAHRVIVISLDEQSSRLRKSSYEFGLQIGFDQIQPEDLASLQKILSLSDVQVNALDMLKRVFKDRWLDEIMADEGSEAMQKLVEDGKIHDGTVGAIQRKLGRLLSKLAFLRPQAADNFVERILGHLQRGDSVVIEFGRYGNDLPAYVFVANFLTRRLHERYVELKETAEGSGGPGPNKLVIVIEEAHKFLEPGVAEHTIFGTIARELRKYNVTLFIVDQRPSQIDSEVMSQIGTRITCALSDEKDIAAVFTGVSGAQTLRSVLAALDSKQQALLLGHALPMPVAVRTVAYDQAKANEFSLPTLNAAERRTANRRALGRPDDDDSLLS